ncbi:S-adenosyl-L-methionine-dependent methyltransferase [Gongronella butleri]|nr:S-adenosyl-L-methionine-dependent methyltransferase [Gongronella butleri]
MKRPLLLTQSFTPMFSTFHHYDPMGPDAPDSTPNSSTFLEANSEVLPVASTSIATNAHVLPPTPIVAHEFGGFQDTHTRSEYVGLVMDALRLTMQTVKSEVHQSMQTIQIKQAGGLPAVLIEAIKPCLYQVNRKHSDAAVNSTFIVNAYAWMVAFMSVYQSLAEVIFCDLLFQGSLSDQRDVEEMHQAFDAYLRIFAPEDALFSRSDDPFTWFHEANRTHIVRLLVQDLRNQLEIDFNSFELVDTILTQFYSRLLLEELAACHQKSYGQFYTPDSVTRFMWDRCFQDEEDTIPAGRRVLDPCMGIGSFLCTFLRRLVGQAQQHLWNDGPALQSLLSELPSNIWGIDIDPFAYRLAKFNILVHLTPLYRRCMQLGIQFEESSLDRLCLFRNDTLRLPLPDPETDPWEFAQIHKLRNPDRLTFDYIVINPPYMTRKSNSQPDWRLLANAADCKATQGYISFLRFCYPRLNPTIGQLAFIVPQQWLVLASNTNFRARLWTACEIIEMFLFPKPKVWQNVATDSLIVRMRLRQPGKVCPPAMVLDHKNASNTPLETMLWNYSRFDVHRASLTPEVLFKLTPVDNVLLLDFGYEDHSYEFMLPWSNVTGELDALTQHLPRLCLTEDAPLTWNRGPSISPAYGHIVRDCWARAQFSNEHYSRFVRPAFYWNGKKMEMYRGNSRRMMARNSAIAALCSDDDDDNNNHKKELILGKERVFWQARDPERMAEKESFCEAYLRRKPNSEYAVIMIDKDSAEEQLDPNCALAKYLDDVYSQLMYADKQYMSSQTFDRCGHDVGPKLVHPSICQFSKSWPRQRFFLDWDNLALTTQCIYLTLSDADRDRRHATFAPLAHNASDMAAVDKVAFLYFLGLVNSSLFQHFCLRFCRFNGNSTMHMFKTSMSKVPYAPPTREHAHAMVQLVQMHMALRERIYAVIERVPVKPGRVILGKMRLHTWDVDNNTRFDIQLAIPFVDDAFAPDNALDGALMQGGGTADERIVRLLKAQSLTQHAIEHIIYDLYHIPWQARLILEKDLDQGLSAQWADWQDQLQQTSPLHMVESILNGTFE